MISLEKICEKINIPPTVCIDYLQLLAAGSENTKNTLEGILRKIFNSSRDTDTTFILISSFNRSNYNTEISYESLKESTNIEFSADGIWRLQLLLDKCAPADAEKTMKDIPRHIQLKCLKISMLEYGDFTDYNTNNSKNYVPSDESTDTI